MSTRSFVGFVTQARAKGYTINLIYYRLDSVELAVERVKIRVAEGGHDIQYDTIIRRYYAGLRNFINLYKDHVDYWMLIDNSRTVPELIAEGRIEEQPQILNLKKWDVINKLTQTEIKDKVLKGGKMAIERLLARKRKDNSYVIVSENGKVVKLNANDIKK